MIKVISLDIGGTLIKNDDLAETKYDLKSLAFTVNMPYEEVRQAYKDVFQKMNGHFMMLVKEFCDKLDIPVDDKVKTFLKEKFSCADMPNGIDENDIITLKKLKDKGYKVILFSNSCCLLNNNISQNITNLVDDIFYSYELGYTKSDSESYRYIEKKLGFHPEEFLHIGDTLKSDYLDPIKNGWHALYFGISNDKEVKSISDLKEILDYLD